MPLTHNEVETLIVIERVTASISVIATLLLITTFILIKEFRTLSNTLIFYASFANIFANVAALIGGSALGHEDGALCQFQGFLLEMFMQSDPLWSCAMAINVYLVFFRRYDAHMLKRLYWIYALICYGLPFIPAMFCLFYSEEKKGKMYGDATLWCWINNDWAAVRIYSYYAPIWVAILLALLIYLRVGLEIFQKRSQLRAADSSHHLDPKTTFISGTRTTEIQVTTDLWKEISDLDPLSPLQSAHVTKESLSRIEPNDQYSITICAHGDKREKDATSPRTIRSSTFPRRPSAVDKVKWAYTKCALLFAASILITWVPASVNRVHGLLHPKHPSFALNVGSAIVLPLQGFWNTVIYFTTSLAICRDVWRNWRDRKHCDGFENLEVVRMNVARASVGNSNAGKVVALEMERSRSVRSLSDSLC